MENKDIEIHSTIDSKVTVFVNSASKAYARDLDMSSLKTQVDIAKRAGKILAGYFLKTPIDSIIALGGTQIVAAFMAECLMQSGENSKQDIAIVTPDIVDGKMFFDGKSLPYVMSNHVLILKDKVLLKEISIDIESVKYYGGHLVGVAGIYGCEEELPTPYEKIFTQNDIQKHIM